MIPGLTNQQWIEADTEGVYRGQCTQYCGVQHAHMGLEVVAQSDAEFRKWQDAQRKSAATASVTGIDAGKQLFWIAAQVVIQSGEPRPKAPMAPDLTHLKSRRLIAAGLLTNTPDHLVKWITHAQDLKPGTRMPSMVLTATEIASLSAFLSTLN